MKFLKLTVYRNIRLFASFKDPVALGVWPLKFQIAKVMMADS